MAYLVLVRHGKSKWNALGLWTGWTDVELDDEGVKEAKEAAKHLKDITLHKAHTSKLKRAKQTLEEIKKALKINDLKTEEHESLNERHYGIHTGKNKWEVKKELGEVEFNNLRRNWNYPIPEGETLKDVHDRVVPYYKKEILSDLKDGKNIIVSAHGNSLRALMKHLENIADDDIANTEIGTAELHIYKITEEGKVESKEIRAANKNKV